MLHTAGLLANPALFSGVEVDRCALAQELVDIVRSGVARPIEARGLCLLMLLTTFAHTPTLPHATHARLLPHQTNTPAHSVESHPELRQELATAASNEEIYAVLDAIRAARAGTPPSPPLPDDGDGSTPTLTLAAASAHVPEGAVLWRRVPCLRCAPGVRSRRAAGVPCTWVVLLGVGRAVLTPAAFVALRAAAHARDWLCRPHALYLCLENGCALLAALLADGAACLYTRP